MSLIPRVSVKEAVAVLEKGGVVAFPTETSYGLAADARNPKAVRKVFAIKGRKPEKTMPLIVSTLAMAKRVAVFPEMAIELAEEHWPGPLTMILALKKGSKLTSAVIAKDGTIALRVSGHPTAVALSRTLDRPIVSTSANRSGAPACYTPEAIDQAFAGLKDLPDAMIDGGELPRTEPSTIVRVEHGDVVVIRKGSVKM